MIKILVVTYNFPPEGGPAVQRAAKFIKYLTRFEAKTFVLTAGKKNKIVDETLLEDTVNCQVTTSLDYGTKFGGEFKKIFWRFFIPDKSVMWKYTAVKAGLKIIEKEKIDIIFSTSPPHSTHLIAEELALKTGLKWIVDFRDEWVDNSLFSRAKLIKKQKKMEQSVLNNCNHVITCTDTAKKNFSSRIQLDRITFIPNGYDEEDFKNIDTQKSNSQNDNLVISYAGRLNELHSPISFFRALSNLVKNKKLDNQVLSVEIIGNLENKKWLRDFPELIDIVSFTPYLEHDKLLKTLNRADVLLLFATKMNSTEFFPAKMFEYFRLKKNIFGIISSKGELWKAVSEYGNSYLAIDSDENQIKNCILNLLKDYENNNFKKIINYEFIESFNRKKQAEQLYDLCTNILKDN